MERTYDSTRIFTADAAIYDSNGMTYGMAGAMDALANGAVVVPQEQCVRLGPCRICMVLIPGPTKVCFRISCPGFTRTFCP